VQKGKGTQWGSLFHALKGVNQKEIDTHKKDNSNRCWRCGERNHRSVDCCASKTKAGNELPRVSGISSSLVTKRKREEEEPMEGEGALAPYAKKEKIAAVTIEDEDIRDVPIRAGQLKSEEDFGEVEICRSPRPSP